MNNTLKENPLVSIIIRTKNEEKWISLCLNALSTQSYKNFEIIIVDNYSKDKTIQKIKKYNVKTVFIKNFLPGKAINQGIKKSRGKIIVCLSAHCIPVNNSWLKNLIKHLSDNKVAGVYLTSWFPDWMSGLKIENLTVYIMSVFNTAGNRAIMIGIALGIASTSLKVLLGVDRSYLGSGED